MEPNAWLWLTGLSAAAGMVLFFLVLVWLRLLRAETNLLPPIRGTDGIRHPMLGARLHSFLMLPQELRGRALVVVVASPSCPKCDEQMDIVLKAQRKQPFPVLCLYELEEVKDGRAVLEFVNKYETQIKLQPLPSLVRKQMGIQGTPFLFLLDEKGVVRRVRYSLSELLSDLHRLAA